MKITEIHAWMKSMYWMFGLGMALGTLGTLGVPLGTLRQSQSSVPKGLVLGTSSMQDTGDPTSSSSLHWEQGNGDTGSGTGDTGSGTGTVPVQCPQGLVKLQKSMLG